MIPGCLPQEQGVELQRQQRSQKNLAPVQQSGVMTFQPIAKLPTQKDETRKQDQPSKPVFVHIRTMQHAPYRMSVRTSQAGQAQQQNQRSFHGGSVGLDTLECHGFLIEGKQLIQRLTTSNVNSVQRGVIGYRIPKTNVCFCADSAHSTYLIRKPH